MDNQEQKFELIISTESKVLSCNITDFEKQAEQFLSTLTQNFETDDDFAAAKEEVKLLKELEDKTRAAIKNAQQGDINQLIEQAEAIAERFRQERLSRDEIVKTKEVEIKERIVTAALDEIMKVRHSNCDESSISLALESTMPKNKISQRIQEATKNKRTIDGLKKAVNAEKMLILAEITQEIARIQSRLKLIPLGSSYLFSDSVKLIAGTDELEPIIAERIQAEKQREAEIKAKAEQEAIARAQREAAQTESTATAQNAVENNEPVETFAIYIQATLSQAKAVATQLKRQFPNLRLKRIEE